MQREATRPRVTVSAAATASAWETPGRRVMCLLGATVAAVIAVVLAGQPSPSAAAAPGGTSSMAQIHPLNLPSSAVQPLSGGIMRPLDGAAANPSAAYDLHIGHVDALAPQLVDGELVMMVKDDTRLYASGVEFRDPAQVSFRVLEGAQQDIPEGFDFLGTPGDQVWVLPQTQDMDLVWPGWSTEHASLTGQLDSPVTFRLVSVDGPGSLVLFQDVGFGQANVLASTTQGLPAEWSEQVPAHVHASWAFSAPGSYTLGFEAAGTMTDGTRVSTGVVPYRFFVDGELAEGPPPRGDDSDDEDPESTPGADAEQGQSTGGDDAGQEVSGTLPGAGSGNGPGADRLAHTGIDDPGALTAAAVALVLLGLAFVGQPRRNVSTSRAKTV